jgi:hypothetical protein
MEVKYCHDMEKDHSVRADVVVEVVREGIIYGTRWYVLAAEDQDANTSCGVVVNFEII